MKPLPVLLLMLVAAAVAAVITYLALTNRQLRASLAERQAADQAARSAGAPPVNSPGAKPVPPPWRPTRIVRSESPAAASPETAAAGNSNRVPGQAELNLVAVENQTSPSVGVPGPTVWTGGTWSGEGVRYTALPGSRCMIGGAAYVEGTTNRQPWEIRGSVIGGYLDLPAGVNPCLPLKADAELPIEASVKIPVRTLKSYQKRMDEAFQEAMQMSQYPNIEYHLFSLRFRRMHTNDFSAFRPAPISGISEYVATGELVVHGVTNLIQMPVFCWIPEAGQLHLGGSTPLLKMTSFGITPPTADLGVGKIKAEDTVVVSFDWALAQKQSGAR